MLTLKYCKYLFPLKCCVLPDPTALRPPGQWRRPVLCILLSSGCTPRCTEWWARSPAPCCRCLRWCQHPRTPWSRSHIHHKDHHEQRCGCSCRMEDVLGVVVLDVLHKQLVDLRLQLQQVTPAELLPTHFLHTAKQRQCLLADAQVARLQSARCEERPISSAHLGCKTHLMKRSHTNMTINELVSHSPPPSSWCIDL